ncbi:hypothetical protein, partial [Pseudomonas aeruginosa]|uniref:hypothetical protein n=1 Tax=Pseudomonas aeruginosa TaxID=287 RepID=UPI00223840AD
MHIPEARARQVDTGYAEPGQKVHFADGFPLLLLGQGVSRKALENAVANLRGGEAVNDPNVEESRQALDKYTV